MDNLLIINNLLPWDGTYLGSYNNIIISRWDHEGNKYYGIRLSLESVNGIVFCSATKTKDLLPCIVDDLKPIFGLTARGTHRIKLDDATYILYYSPITIKGEIVFETQLNKLSPTDPLRVNPIFRKEIQKIIVFRDILAIRNTGEQNIAIRITKEGNYIPISINEKTTYVSKNDKHNYSIITPSLLSKWFDVHTHLHDIVIELANHTNKETHHKDLAVIIHEIRNKIDKTIKGYEGSYIWYSYFIMERLSRYLLAEDRCYQ